MMRRWLSPGIPLAVGSLLRLWALGRYSLWFDEIHTVHAALNGEYLYQPPLMPLLVRLWLPLAPSDLWLRLLPVLLGIPSIWLAWKLAGRLIGPAGATLVAWFMALSPAGVYYARELRMYSLVITLSLLLIDLWLSWLEEGGKRRLAACVLAGSALLYSHHHGVLLVIGLTGMSPWVAPRSKLPLGTALRRGLLAAGWIALAFQPFLIPRLAFLWGSAVEPSWYEPVGWPLLHRWIRLLTCGYEPPGWVGALLAASILPAAVGGALLPGRPRRLPVLLLGAVLIPGAIFLLISWIVPAGLFHPRYGLFALGPLLVCAAAGLLRLRPGWLRSILVCMILLLQGLALTYQYQNRFTLGPQYGVRPRKEYRTAAEYILRHHRPGDAVGATCRSGVHPAWYYLDLRQGVSPIYLLDLQGRYRQQMEDLYHLGDRLDEFGHLAPTTIDQVVNRHERLWLYASQWDDPAPPGDFDARHRREITAWLGERFPSLAHRSYQGVTLTLYDLTRRAS